MKVEHLLVWIGVSDLVAPKQEHFPLPFLQEKNKLSIYRYKN